MPDLFGRARRVAGKNGGRLWAARSGLIPAASRVGAQEEPFRAALAFRRASTDPSGTARLGLFVLIVIRDFGMKYGPAGLPPSGLHPRRWRWRCMIGLKVQIEAASSASL